MKYEEGFIRFIVLAFSASVIWLKTSFNSFISGSCEMFEAAFFAITGQV
jgi:hypothetical protein